MKRLLHPGYWDADQLYDLQADPGERLNLAKDPKHAQTVPKLKSRLKEWLAGFQRPFGEFAPLGRFRHRIGLAAQRQKQCQSLQFQQQ